MLAAECVFFADAYATDLAPARDRLRHPERLVGYGLLGSLEAQHAVEIVDSEAVADDALELAQELFGALGKGVVLVDDEPGLFLGRTIGSIVNEAIVAVADEVASPEDVETAMRLGANYPIGPIAWGREIGGARVRRILRRLADAEGEAFAPHRSLWMLDVAEDAAAGGGARMSREVWVIDAVRTPIGRYGGALANVRPDDLAAIAVRAIVERTGIAPGEHRRRLFRCGESER